MRVFGVFFLVIGIISILVGFFLLFPLVWGIPLTLLGIVMTSAGGRAVRRRMRAKIETRIRKIEFKKKRRKLEPAKADLLIDKLKIKQAKYME
ncbi:hypothetical protein E3J48_04545 [Candidatus Aerophobetes bacterium]|uniref:Uncharacterized protein n=1 Tax=Aerophobetes bacterium TaxID=2030807 RepID=A0A523W5H1_UNCAE|nr:MAG: hypothetical protein E3J48_04545 [Candidatus Aerophobetes bacterium]